MKSQIIMLDSMKQRDIHELPTVMNSYSQEELKNHVCNMISKDTAFVNHIKCEGDIVTVEVEVKFL